MRLVHARRAAEVGLVDVLKESVHLHGFPSAQERLPSLLHRPTTFVYLSLRLRFPPCLARRMPACISSPHSLLLVQPSTAKPTAEAM